VLAALLGGSCAEKFELPPVPDGRTPEPGSYNFDRAWPGMGEVLDMALAGGALYVLTERDGARDIEIYLPGATAPTQVPEQLRGTYEGLRHPTAIASASYQTIRYLFVADQRGPESLARSRVCIEGDNCFLRLEAETNEIPHLASRELSRDVDEDFVFETRLRVDELSPGGEIEIFLGTAEGRPGLWVAVSGDGFIRAVRSDGAFPVDSLAFSPGAWHTVRLVHSWASSRYDVAVDDSVFTTLVPVYFPLNRPARSLGFRARGAQFSVDDLRVSAPDTVLALGFETEAEVAEGWTMGPFFRNEPPPAVLRYAAREHGGPSATFTNPRWTAIHGVALAHDLTLCVAIEEEDPTDATGVLRRTEVQRIERSGAPLPPIAENGTGVGFVASPGSLAFDGADLLVVEPGLDRVQKLSLETPNTAEFVIPPIDAEEALFRGPEDVVTDDLSFVYVADTGNDRVLRFQPTGAFADTVYSLTFHPTLEAGAILAPAAVVADSNEVWIGDRPGKRIVVLKRSASVSGGTAE